MARPSEDIIRSRMMGALYGMAVGDALGGPYEFQRRGGYSPSGEMEESSTFLHQGKPLAPGSWTDDTSMGLALAASLTEKNGLVWTDAADKWTAWMRHGYMSVINECFDIGLTTRAGLGAYVKMQEQFKQSGIPIPITPRFNPNSNMAGNGSIMRLAPLPIFYYSDLASVLYEQARISSGITHSAEACLDGCVVMSAMIVGFIRAPEAWPVQEKKEKIMNKDFRLEHIHGWPNEGGPAEGTEIVISSPAIKSIHYEESYKVKPLEDVRTSGYVAHTLEAALWALWRSNSFEEGLLMLLPLGEDCDTVCAVYGQLAGACFGIESIPERWVSKLQRKEEILDKVWGDVVDAALNRGRP